MILRLSLVNCLCAIQERPSFVEIHERLTDAWNASVEGMHLQSAALADTEIDTALYCVSGSVGTAFGVSFRLLCHLC